jgi:hypothetical protein
MSGEIYFFSAVQTTGKNILTIRVLKKNQSPSELHSPNIYFLIQNTCLTSSSSECSETFKNALPKCSGHFWQKISFTLSVAARNWHFLQTRWVRLNRHDPEQSGFIRNSLGSRSGCTRQSFPPPSWSWAPCRCTSSRSWCPGSGCTGGSRGSHSPVKDWNDHRTWYRLMP